MNEKDTAFGSGDSSSIKSRRFHLDRALDESGLPAGATECVRWVMSNLRLWPGERADVASELIAHFIDGIAAGHSIEELVENFGDPSRTAALITNAKKRQRGWRWRSLQILGGTAIALVVFYSALTFRFYCSKAEPNVDYVAVLNSKAKNVPANERAYPLYVEASDALKPLKTVLTAGRFKFTKPVRERLGGDLRDTTPDDQKWSDVVAILERCAPIIEKTREATGKPGMGCLLSDVGSNEAPPVVLNAAYRMPVDVTALAGLLRFDAISAAYKGNASLAAADIEAQLRMADHLGETPLLLYGMLAQVADGSAFHTIDIILARYPDLFDHELLSRLAHEVAERSTALTPYWEGEYLAFADVIQRIYTDDGNGNGRLAADVPSVVRELELRGTPEKKWWQTTGTAAIMPIAGLSAPDRRDALRFFREFIDTAIATNVLPSAEVERRITALRRHFPSLFFGKSFALSPRSLMDFAANLENDRRALLVAISLELYHLEKGTWPSAIDVLAPRFIPSIPTDRMTALPLGFRIEHGRPIVFSAGSSAESAENILWPPEFIRSKSK